LTGALPLIAPPVAAAMAAFLSGLAVRCTFWLGGYGRKRRALGRFSLLPLHFRIGAAKWNEDVWKAWCGRWPVFFARLSRSCSRAPTHKQRDRGREGERLLVIILSSTRGARLYSQRSACELVYEQRVNVASYSYSRCTTCDL
jgi:hypothetical protein